MGLLPLLSHRLEIGKVTLSGAHLFIQTKADGSSNLRDLLQASTDPKEEATSEPAATTPPAASDKQPWQISLQGIALVDAERPGAGRSQRYRLPARHGWISIWGS